MEATTFDIPWRKGDGDGEAGRPCPSRRDGTDPVDVGRDAGIYPVVPGSGASEAEGDDSNEVVLAVRFLLHQWPAAVTLHDRNRR